MTDTAIVESNKVNREIADTIAVGKGGINFSNAGEVMEYARMMAASQSAVPKHLRGQPGSCLGVLDDAIRFRINPYALARQSYFVNDQLAYQAAVFMAIINAHAPLKTRPDIKFEGEGQEMRAIVIGTFRDGSVREYKSPRVADISPKNSPLWKSDPGQQLAYYSLRAFARRWCPEVILGIHDVDELREAAMTDITPIDEAKPKAPTSLDDFAAAAEAGAVLQGEHSGNTSSPAGHPTTPGPAGEESGSAVAPNAPPAAADLKVMCVERAMEIAVDNGIDDEDDRLATLEVFRGVWLQDDKLPHEPDFVRAVFDTAGKVARKELPEAKARLFLSTLIK